MKALEVLGAVSTLVLLGAIVYLSTRISVTCIKLVDVCVLVWS